MPDPIIGGSSGGDSHCAPIDGPYLLSTADTRLSAGIVFPGVIVASSGAPSDTRYLWRDTSATPPSLKFFDGIVWSAFAAMGPTGPEGPGPWSVLTADFTAGAIGANGLTVAVAQVGGFAAGAYAMIVMTDVTGAQAFYRVTASPSTLDPSSLTLTRVGASPSADADYVFAVSNGALVSISGVALGGASMGNCLEPVVADSSGTPEIVFAEDDIVMA